MSRETLEHLNTHTLIGNTDHRGTAWHYRADLQGTEPNHYSGPIPVEDVRHRLFTWQAVSRRIGVELPADITTVTHLDSNGTPMRWAQIADKQAICRDDNHHVMGIFAPSYAMHQYDEWLLTTVANILDAEGFRAAEILKAEGEKQAVILAAEARREAAFRDAEARERAAEAEAKATNMVSEAIAGGDIQAINYFVAQKYIEALKEFANGPNQKTIFMPLEASSVIASIGGITEIAREAFGRGAQRPDGDG